MLSCFYTTWYSYINSWYCTLYFVHVWVVSEMTYYRMEFCSLLSKCHFINWSIPPNYCYKLVLITGTTQWMKPIGFMHSLFVLSKRFPKSKELLSSITFCYCNNASKQVNMNLDSVAKFNLCQIRNLLFLIDHSRW